jgi:hypothetical protein
MAEEKRQFPTEVIDLPSKGYFYPDGSPLSSGQVEIKYMTAREEDILTSANLIQKGIVLDKLLEALIVSEGVNLDDVLIGDKNAIMVASRVLAYGKDYEFEYTDPSNNEKKTHSVDLSKLEHKKIDFKKYTKGKNEFLFELPTSKKKITFKLLTQREEKSIDAEIKALRKINKVSGIGSEITTRLKASILSVDGNDERQFINNFIDNEFLSMDSFSYRANLVSITPDVNLSETIEYDNGDLEEVAVPITATFFWPSAL